MSSSGDTVLAANRDESIGRKKSEEEEVSECAPDWEKRGNENRLYSGHIVARADRPLVNVCV